jgi:hypothetical protein
MFTSDPTAHAIAVGAMSIYFLAGAIAKFSNQAAFADALRGYSLLPDWLVAPFSLLFPAAEAGGALLVLYGPTCAVGGTVLTALALCFAAAIAVNLLRGNTSIDCGCFGPFAAVQPVEAQRITWWHAVRALAVAAIAAATTMSVAVRHLTLLDDCVVLFGIATLTVISLTVDAVLAVPYSPTR